MTQLEVTEAIHALRALGYRVSKPNGLAKSRIEISKLHVIFANGLQASAHVVADKPGKYRLDTAVRAAIDHYRYAQQFRMGRVGLDSIAVPAIREAWVQDSERMSQSEVDTINTRTEGHRKALPYPRYSWQWYRAEGAMR